MSSVEKKDLIISWIVISLAFAMIFSEGLLGGLAPFVKDFGEGLFVALISVGAGFIFHELAHKYVAIHYGAQAEFRSWNTGLWITLATGIVSLLTPLRFLFAAPGAVWIYGPHISRKQNGIISLAGPVTNIIIAVLFFFLASAMPHGLIGKTFLYGFLINMFLALFNLLPIPPLDGSKVIAWDFKVWALAFFPLLLFYFFF